MPHYHSNAAVVCGELGLPHLVLARPAWPRVMRSAWAPMRRRQKRLPPSGIRGSSSRLGDPETAAFADVDAWFLIRAVTAPDPDTLPRRHQLVLSRGPYDYDDELALLLEHRIDGWSPRTVAAR